jgi:hypothetical protein
MNDRSMQSGPGPLIAMVIAIATMPFSGCAKSPTEILTTVSVEDTVPPLLLLRATVARVSDPTHAASFSLFSLAPGDASDRPGPYFFPRAVPIGVSATWAGDVIVTIEGLDWDTSKILARGSTTARVAAEQTTEAALTMTNVADTGGGDAGGDAEHDGGAIEDAPDAPIDL